MLATLSPSTIAIVGLIAAVLPLVAGTFRRLAAILERIDLSLALSRENSKRLDRLERKSTVTQQDVATVKDTVTNGHT